MQACKVDSDNTQTLVNARDRGGLWRVNKNMQALFLKRECIFRSKTAKFSVKVNCADIVKNMLENCKRLRLELLKPNLRRAVKLDFH